MTAKFCPSISVLLMLLFSGLGYAYDASLVGCWHFNEGSGATAYDSSSRHNNGSIFQAQWTDGKFGKCLNFDGNNDYVNVGNDSSLDLSSNDNFSICFWMKAISQNTSSEARHIIAHVEPSSFSEVIYQFKHEPGTNKISFEGRGLGSSENWNISGPIIVPNQWYFIVGIRKAQVDSVYLYVNTNIEAQVQDPTTGNFIFTNNLFIGNHPLVSSKAFHGSIDEVSIYKKALSAAEINALYKSPANVNISPERSNSVLLSLAPNPFSQSTTITFPNTSYDATLNIYSSTGALILTRNVNNKSIFIWNGLGYAPGTYFIQIRNSGNIFYRSICLTK